MLTQEDGGFAGGRQIPDEMGLFHVGSAMMKDGSADGFPSVDVVHRIGRQHSFSDVFG